jgi:hypothetical protein
MLNYRRIPRIMFAALFTQGFEADFEDRSRDCLD